ncbi:hypothetical protein [Dawidia soli]|uniref:Uncharacterized protein n=1 Tax=Dawidia soli TaxID=2782352 RepID=A0AAP2GJS9_9BACT|nr:hypothetical protein [Dawidia soli]MBT1688298.1 hypothetical protein [Dawidia soli]
MTRQQIIILTGCMAFGIVVLYLLYSLSPFAAEIPRESFERNFDSFVSVAERGDIDLKVNSFYIAGTSKKTVYLGSYSGPLHLLQVTIPSLDTLHMNVGLDTVMLPEDYRVFRMKVDSPFFYLSHGSMPGIFKGSLSTRSAKNFSPKGAPFFAEAVPVSGSRLALKSLSRESNGSELATLTLDSPFFEFKPDILEKQVDGIFCVDGNLLYNKEINRIVYVYAYRNEYMIADTSLNLIHRFHTIDTFSQAPIKVANIKSKSYRTLATPPARINVKSCVSENRLFIQSPLLAKNEDKMEFLKGCTIDVYDMVRGTYLYSFHLEAKYNHLPSSFSVVGENLIAIYDHHLILYSLILPEQNHQKTLVSQYN